jgi:hypothetical protein
MPLEIDETKVAMIADPRAPGGFYLLNRADYDERVHTLFVEPLEAPVHESAPEKSAPVVATIDDAVAMGSGAKKKK